MKQILKVILTMACMAWMAVACKTTNHSTVERQTHDMEHRRETKTDTVNEHTTDSVLVYVERGDSFVHIIERKVHTREKIKVVRDTVVIHVRNDTIVKVESVREKTSRSPPRWKRYLALGLLTIAALVAVKFLTILKHFKL